MDEIISQKQCRTCQLIKPVSEFHRNPRKKDGLELHCKVCRNAYKNKRRKQDPLKHKNSALKRNHGITLEDFNRMFENQDGKCPICGKTFEGRVGRDVHVDHNHTTGKIRELLCYKCNLLLGYCAENIRTLHRAIVYLCNHASS